MPSQPPRIELDGANLRVSGAMTFATVTGLLRESQGLIGAGDGPLRVDLSGVSHADSAGLALLMEWLRLARGAGRELEYLAVTEQMLAIAGAGGLLEILPLAPG